MVGDNFAGFEDIEVGFVAEGSFGAELTDYGDVLAEHLVEVEVTIQGDFGGFDAEVAGGEIVSLLER